MQKNFQTILATSRGLLVPTLALTMMAAETGPRLQTVEVQSGSVKFEATTNVSAISIHGQSGELKARALVTRENGQLILEELEAKVDPKSLSTGMAIRDNHMREKIFANGGEAPVLVFTSPKVVCPDGGKGKDAVCQVSGNFSMRGVVKPFSIPLKVKADGNRYKVTGDGTIKITDYGIERPCQLGVCVTDAVKLKLEFQAEERVTSTKSEPAVGVRP